MESVTLNPTLTGGTANAIPKDEGELGPCVLVQKPWQIAAADRLTDCVA
jgi:hypothetical protein